MHFDGSKLRNGLGAGIVLTSPKRDQPKYVLQIHFAASNNVAEYEALIHGLKVAKEIGIRRILCYGDSDLVVQQVSDNWDALDANMALYRFHVQKLSGYFEGCEFHHIPRAENDAADMLSKLGSTKQSIPPGIALEQMRKPSIAPSPESESIFIPASSAENHTPMEVDPQKDSEPLKRGRAEVITIIERAEVCTSAENREIDTKITEERATPIWAQPIFSYLKDAILPSNEVLARQTIRRAKA